MLFLVLQKAKRWCDDDEDSFQCADMAGSSDTAAAPRDKPSRARKPVKYQVFDSDSEDDY